MRWTPRDSDRQVREAKHSRACGRAVPQPDATIVAARTRMLSSASPAEPVTWRPKSRRHRASHRRFLLVPPRPAATRRDPPRRSRSRRGEHSARAVASGSDRGGTRLRRDLIQAVRQRLEAGRHVEGSRSRSSGACSRCCDAGASHPEAAARHGVSAASDSRGRGLERAPGNIRPGARGGDRRSSRMAAPATLILQVRDEMRDAAIEELHTAPRARGHRSGCGTWRRFSQRHRITPTKGRPMPRGRIGRTS